MSIIGTILIGLIVGALAKFLLPGRDPGGWIVTIPLGLAGSLLAHFIGRGVGWYGEGDPAGFIASVVGAVVLPGFYRLALGKRTALAQPGGSLPAKSSYNQLPN